jgi:endonuclease/exonuclease/phosphatase family metal-dependent hydrolase
MSILVLYWPMVAEVTPEGRPISDLPAGRARVMTWNIWWRFGPHWQDRQHGLVETLRAVDADVVALQEVWGTAETTQAHEFAGQLGLQAAFAAPSYPPAPEAPETPDQEGVALGIGLLSRWPIVGLRRAELPARHRPLRPVAMVATLAHPAGPLHVVAACLEYEPAYNDDRIAQGHALVDLATDPALDGPLPVVVAGDLNAAPDSPVLRPLHDVLTDAWSAGGGDPTAVTIPSTHPSAPVEAEELIDQRIDHIFLRPGQLRQRVVVESATLAGAPVAGLYPSDHQAVVCDLSWTAGA